MANLRNGSWYLTAHGDGASVLVGILWSAEVARICTEQATEKTECYTWDHIEQHSTHIPMIVNMKNSVEVLLEFDHSINCSSCHHSMRQAGSEIHSVLSLQAIFNKHLDTSLCLTSVKKVSSSSSSCLLPKASFMVLKDSERVSIFTESRDKMAT